MGSCRCHSLDVCPPPDSILVCYLLCWLHVYLSSNLIAPDIITSILFCSLSEIPHLCCCQHIHFYVDEGTVSTPVTKCIFVFMLIVKNLDSKFSKGDIVSRV